MPTVARKALSANPTTRRHLPPHRRSGSTPSQGAALSEEAYQLVPWDPLDEEAVSPSHNNDVVHKPTRSSSVLNGSGATDEAVAALPRCDVGLPAHHSLAHREALGDVKRRLEHCVVGSSRDWLDAVAERTNEQDPQFHIISEEDLTRYTRLALAEQIAAPPRAVTALLRASSRNIHGGRAIVNGGVVALTDLERLAQEQAPSGHHHGVAKSEGLNADDDGGVGRAGAAPLVVVDEDDDNVRGGELCHPLQMARPSALTVALIFHQFESASRKDIVNLELQSRLDAVMWYHEDSIAIDRRNRESMLMRLENQVALQAEALAQQRTDAAAASVTTETQHRKELERLRLDTCTALVHDWGERVRAAQMHLERTRLVVLVETRERDRRAQCMHERDTEHLQMLGSFLEGRASQLLHNAGGRPPADADAALQLPTAHLPGARTAAGEEEPSARAAVHDTLRAITTSAVGDTERLSHNVRELIEAPWPRTGHDHDAVLPQLQDQDAPSTAAEAAYAVKEEEEVAFVVPSVRHPEPSLTASSSIVVATGKDRTASSSTVATAPPPQSLTALADMLSNTKKKKGPQAPPSEHADARRTAPSAHAVTPPVRSVPPPSAASSAPSAKAAVDGEERQPGHMTAPRAAASAPDAVAEPSIRRRPLATHHVEDDDGAVVEVTPLAVVAVAGRRQVPSADASSLPRQHTTKVRQQQPPLASPPQQQQREKPAVRGPAASAANSGNRASAPAAVKFSSRVDVRPFTITKQQVVDGQPPPPPGGAASQSKLRSPASAATGQTNRLTTGVTPEKSPLRERQGGAGAAPTSTVRLSSTRTGNDAVAVDMETNGNTNTATTSVGTRTMPSPGSEHTRSGSGQATAKTSALSPKSAVGTTTLPAAASSSASFMRSPRASTVIGSSAQPPNSSTADTAHAFWSGVTTLVAPKFIEEADAAADSVDSSGSSDDDDGNNDDGSAANILPTWQAKACGESSIEREVLKHIRRHRAMVARCLRRGVPASPSSSVGSPDVGAVASHPPYPSMHGWILKSSGVHMSWQRRYFFLNRSGRLKMSVAADPFHSSGGPIRWETVVRVEDILRVEDDTTGGGVKLPPDHHLSNCFHVDVATHCGPRLTDVALKRLRFCCFSRKDRNGWIHGLRKARHAVRLLEERGVVEPSPMSKLLCAAHPELLAQEREASSPTTTTGDSSPRGE